MNHDSSAALHDFEVVSNEEVAQGIYRIVMLSPRLARAIRPGQFMNLSVPGNAAHILRIPLSFASASPGRGTIELVYAVVGEGTERLARMRAGARSSAIGPCGHGWDVPVSGRSLLVAGGVGAPPIIAAAGLLSERGLSFDVVLAAQTSSRLWGAERARELGAREVLLATDDGSIGIRGLATQAVEELLARESYGQIMSCGPAPMMAGVARLAAHAHCACQVSMERMMACGFGACNCCSVPMVAGGYKSCCTDGPVFDAGEVAW